MQWLDFKDKRYWNLLLTIGLPIAVQNLILNSLTLVDNILIGGLGEESIVAVGIANRFNFIFMLFMFGINSGANIFSAQFWGKKDINGIRKILGISLAIGLIVSVPFVFMGISYPQLFMDFFTDDKGVSVQGAGYLALLALSFPLSAISSSVGMQSRGIGRTTLPLIASSISLAINTVLGYLFIYGKLGMSAMGVSGAALATVIAKVIECIVLITLIYRKNYELAVKPADLKGYTSDFVKRFFKTVSPVILNELFWAVGVTGYTFFYNKLGTEAYATVQIMDVINSVFFFLFIGIGNACGAIIGRFIGAGDEETARLYAKRSVAAGALIGVAMTLILLITAPFILMLFHIEETTLLLCRKAVWVLAAFLVPKAVNMIMIVGVCRGGGDTVFAAKIDVGAPWLVGLPLAFLGAVVLRLPVYWVMAMVGVEEFVKCFLGIKRLLGNRWLNNVVKGMDKPAEGMITSN